MSANQYGLALAAPSKQTVLPIVMPSGKVYGFFPIAETTFTGTETTFALTQGAVPITTVTLPPKNVTNVYDEQRVQQFMAAQWPAHTEGVQPWRGYEELVAADVPNTIGYYSWWSMPVTMWFKHFGRGVFLDSLKFSMSDFVYAPPSSTPPVVTTPQVLTWATTLNAQAFATTCPYFDFNWVALFQAQFQMDPTQEGAGVIPLSITTTGNPAGGYFKSSVLQGQGGQVIYPGGGAVFNTIRILRLQDPPAGSYTFNFNVSANINGAIETVPAVLNLTVT